MTQGQREDNLTGGSWGLVALFWAAVLIPLAWGIYNTMLNVVALFTVSV